MSETKRWHIEQPEQWPFPLEVMAADGTRVMRWDRGHVSSADRTVDEAMKRSGNAEQLALLNRIVDDHNALAGTDDPAALLREVRQTLEEARAYVLTTGRDQDMAPVVERIEQTLAKLPKE